MMTQDAEHLVGQLQMLLPQIIQYAQHLLAAILILIAGFWVAHRAHMLLVRSLSKTKYLDAMLRNFFGNIVRYFILTITVLAVLAQFGIETTSLVAVLGAAGLAIGLALQGTLSHLAAGVMLLMFRPFRIGQHVQIGAAIGTVKELSLFWTEVVTAENVQVIIPNGSVWGQPLRNFSVYPQAAPTGQARFRLPGVDPATARQGIAALLEANEHVLKDPAPTVMLERTALDNVLEFVVTFAPDGGEAAVPAVKTDVIQSVYDAFEARGAVVQPQGDTTA